MKYAKKLQISWQKNEIFSMIEKFFLAQTWSTFFETIVSMYLGIVGVLLKRRVFSSNFTIFTQSWVVFSKA